MPNKMNTFVPRHARKLLLACAVQCLACLPAWAVTVAPVADLRADFMMGADVSMLDQMEQAGGKFYDAQGTQKDALVIMKENGVNWVRLRLWHTPINDADVVENGKVISHKGEPKGGGNNDLAATIRLAKRARALGLKYMLDIHYSDHWVDPDKQTKPAAWRDLKGVALQQAVHRYTREVLDKLRAEGVFPDMIQVGNELNGGMLWPDGKTWKAKPEEEIGGDDGFVSLLTEGIRAVREADPKAKTNDHVKVAVHLANGANNELYRRVFDLLTKRNVDYDIIGLSFYAYWHGTVEDYQLNVDDISSRYGKPVLTLETAYAYTLEDGDGFPNLFDAEMQKSVGYKATVQGQTSMVRDVINAMAQVPGERGLGVFYWEPDWYPVKGVGWRTGEGNAWENQAMFDFKGKALPSLAVFKRVREAGSAADTPKLLKGDPIALSAFVGEVWTPPDSLRFAFSDDAQRSLFVSWDDVPAAKLKQLGSFTLHGVAGGVDIEATVQVVPRRNMIEDPSFEKGDLAGWVITGDKGAVSNERNPGNAHSGQQSMHYWLGQGFKFDFARPLTGLTDGTYTLKAWAMGSGGENAMSLFAKDCGDAAVAPEKIVNTGWQKWVQYVVKGVKVKGGKCTVGVSVDAKTGNWGNVDDVEFIRDSGQ